MNRECRFQGQAAGYITAERLSADTASYPFMPLRSVAHLRLVETINKKGRARVEIDVDGTFVTRVATKLLKDSITIEGSNGTTGA